MLLHKCLNLITLSAVLAGCATVDTSVELTPEAPAVPSDALVGQWKLEVTDERADPQSLNVYLKLEGSFADYTYDYFLSRESFVSFLGSFEAHEDAPVVHIKIIKAYTDWELTSITGAVVCRVSFLPGQQASWEPYERVMRGQDVRMNWGNSDGEHRSVLRGCLRQISEAVIAEFNQLQGKAA